MYDMVGKAVRDVVIYILIGLTETRDTDTDTDDLPKAKVISEKKKGQKRGKLESMNKIWKKN